MNQQRIYERVRDHLLTQNAKSQVNLPVQCLYRGPAGRKCAVGCLITDENYDEALEGHGLGYEDDIVLNAVEASIDDTLGDSDILLLNCLQRVHDNVEVSQWPAALAVVAEMFGLKP